MGQKVVVSFQTLTQWREDFVRQGEAAEAEGNVNKANQYFVAASLVQKQIELIVREYTPPAPWF
jgi:hypothetical protein